MSYEKTTWKTGDKVTADKLNHIEDGISEVESKSDAFVIQIVDADWHIYFDKTYAEIKQAIDDGKRVYGTLAYNIFSLYRVYTDSIMFICMDLDLATTPMGMTVKLLEINENDEITTYSADFEPIS